MNELLKNEKLESPRISRRRFLRGVAGVGGVAVVGGFAEAVRLYLQSMGPESNQYGKHLVPLLEEGIDAAIMNGTYFLEANYGVKVSFMESQTDRYQRNARRANKYEQMRVVNILLEEVVKYPQDFFINNDLREIKVLSHVDINLKNGGVTAGFMDRSEPGITIASGGAWVDFDRDSIRKTFHHEVFHRIEFADENSLGLEGWRLANTSTLSRELFGYYAMSNPKEYRASFAAMLMDPSGHIDILNTINETTPPDLRSYLAWQYMEMLSYYDTCSGGKMDSRYWEDLLLGQVEYGYFDKRPLQ